MITDLELGRLVSETKHSLTRNGPRYEGSTGRLMELSETHVIVISSEEINNVCLFGSTRDLRGFSEHPRFRTGRSLKARTCSTELISTRSSSSGTRATTNGIEANTPSTPPTSARR